MISISLLAVFVPTFFFVSATPGMCMTLSMILGMTIGVRKTLWMMAGELAGVALVAIATLAGVAAIMLNFPSVFRLFQLLGGLYLGYLGLQMWMSKGRMAISTESGFSEPKSGKVLMAQGFVTAVANPKGWAFFISLLPPFINAKNALLPQAGVLISIMLLLEFMCLLMYACGGKTFRHFLQKSGNVRMMNRIAGTLMVAVGVSLGIG
ncbi:LysE family translocator [Endozoicomonas sp.]|nr:LysE family translocator [Endozoicomonas sp.]